MAPSRPAWLQPAFVRFCNNLWMAAGTKSLTSPPNPAISFTNLELMKVYSSFGIKKIVSTFGSSFRFINAS
jgi:hypothetical protein